MNMNDGYDPTRYRTVARKIAWWPGYRVELEYRLPDSAPDDPLYRVHSVYYAHTRWGARRLARRIIRRGTGYLPPRHMRKPYREVFYS